MEICQKPTQKQKLQAYYLFPNNVQDRHFHYCGKNIHTFLTENQLLPTEQKGFQSKWYCRYLRISEVYFYAVISVFRPDWLIRLNFRFLRSDNLHKDSHPISWIYH